MRQELQAIIESLGTSKNHDIHAMRAEAIGLPPYPNPEDITWQSVDAGGVPAEWNIPERCEGDRIVLYVHGGGYATGDVNLYRPLCSNLARACRARVLSVDYRLAPEHPFPAALEDTLSAYRTLVSEGTDVKNLVMAGDSAGGGLTIGTLVALRDAGDRLPALGICLSPWFDMTLSNPAIDALSDVDPMVDRRMLEVFRDAYLNGADPETPTASPLHADLEGLPPLLIQVGGAEVLVGEAGEFAERATAAGVDVTYEPWADMIHVWHMFADQLSEAREAIDRIGRFVDERL